MVENAALIGQVRDASRQLVRALGFMNKSLAGTGLAPSAVHALIEIDARPGITARELGDKLRLEKSTVSRMLRKLVRSDDVIESPSEQDGRERKLALSPAGGERIKSIHAYAKVQVAQALARLTPEQCDTVVQGLRLYAGSLTATRDDGPMASVLVHSGYQPGLIAAVTGMHARYYSRMAGFGQSFESVVASGLAAFCDRLDKPVNGIWTAVHADKIVGSVAIDGEDLGPNIAHLRWFIVDDAVRGLGAGRSLLSAALDFVDQNAFAETHLWTFAGLAAARHLYETHGFVCVEERPGAQWGKEVLEQRFVRPAP